MREMVFIVWLILTVFLTCTVIGMIIFAPSDSGKKSTWMELGTTLLSKID